MKRTTLRQRGLALLLVLVMALGLAPTALAADTCPKCGSSDLSKWEIIREPNCHEDGARRRICNSCKKSIYEDLEKDPKNHDAICTDNGDGETHTATCPYHKNYANVREKHTFVDGLCTKCRAVDYSAVKISLPKDLKVYVAVGDEEATLSLGEVSLTLGNADVTDDYDISYNWYYGSKSVGTGETFTLSSRDTEEEDDFTYVCFVMATPKNSLTTKPINASCTVTVMVRELITAGAAVNTEDMYLDLDDDNSRTPTSVADQIYDAANELSNKKPSYVVFEEAPKTKVGEFKSKTDTQYTFSSKDKNYVGDLRFEVGKEPGAYVVNFTVYDERGDAFPGVLTITVEQSLGDIDVLYATTKGETVDLENASFEDFWADTYAKGELTWVRFTTLPASSQGALYTGYSSALRPGSRVKEDDTFYAYADRSSQTLLEEVTFVPGKNFTGYVSIPFEAYGENNKGARTYLNGSMCIFVSDGEVSKVKVTASSADGVSLSGDDFLEIYQDATDSKSENFYIQLLSVPASGDLYLNYSASKRGTKLTASNIAEYPLYYSSKRGDLIDDVTYIPGSAISNTVRYAAYDSKGSLMYVGDILFTRGSLSLSYTAPAAGVSFTSRDFEKLLGEVDSDTYLTFSQPADGTLYFSKNGTASGGTRVTEKDKFYLGNDAYSVNNLLFVPRTGQTGTVTVYFTVHGKGGAELSGQVKITVQAASYTKTFSDVKRSDWFYTYVMDLAQAGVVNGMTATTYSPNGEVKYGEALKMIMLATGYSEQAPTGKHWASGYLSRALSDGLLTKSVDLERKIDRYAIAEISARAMRLPKPSATKSPFADMAMDHASAPYVLALYEAGIVEGSTRNDGALVYYGVNSIRRSEIAAIIWRINNYSSKR